MTCVKCGGKGWVESQNNSYAECLCVREATLKDFFAANLPARFISSTFADYEASPSLLAEFRGALQRRQPVWLWGPPGTGKTLLAVCAWKASVHEDDLSENLDAKYFYIRGDEFYDFVNAGRYEEKKRDILSVLRERGKFIVIDDIDKRKTTAEREDILDSILNIYADAMVPGVITSNRAPVDYLQCFVSDPVKREAMRSRLYYFAVIQAVGDDWRKKHHTGRSGRTT